MTFVNRIPLRLYRAPRAKDVSNYKWKADIKKLCVCVYICAPFHVFAHTKNIDLAKLLNKMQQYTTYLNIVIIAFSILLLAVLNWSGF